MNSCWWVLLANVLALAGTYFVWDIGQWWREHYRGGSFRTVTGVVLAHAGALALFILICYQVLRLASLRPPG